MTHGKKTKFVMGVAMMGVVILHTVRRWRTACLCCDSTTFRKKRLWSVMASSYLTALPGPRVPEPTTSFTSKEVTEI